MAAHFLSNLLDFLKIKLQFTAEEKTKALKYIQSEYLRISLLNLKPFKEVVFTENIINNVKILQ